MKLLPIFSCLLASISLSFAQDSPSQENFFITSEGIGPAKIGETVGAMQAAVAKINEYITYEFVETMGDGYSGVVVKIDDSEELFAIYTEPVAKLTKEATIEIVETRNPAFRVEGGVVGVGTLLTEVAKEYGEFKVEAAEIDWGAEHIKFDDPKTLPGAILYTGAPSFDYYSEAGDYTEAQLSEPFRETRKLKPLSYVKRIMVTNWPGELVFEEVKPNADGVYIVHDVGQLLATIKSNRTIAVMPGDYHLTDAWGQFETDNITWTEEGAIRITGLENLQFVGPADDDESATILASPENEEVLHFHQCMDIGLHNLVIGHDPKQWACYAAVVGARESSNLEITNCDLFGCGSHGLQLNYTHGVKVSQSVIRECTGLLSSFEHSSDIIFENSDFVDNKDPEFGGNGLMIRSCQNVTFKHCAFIENEMNTEFFQVSGTSNNIKVIECEFRDNKMKAITDHAVVEFEKSNVGGTTMNGSVGSVPLNANLQVRVVSNADDENVVITGRGKPILVWDRADDSMFESDFAPLAAWSADKQFLAFQGGHRRSQEVFLYRVEGRILEPITLDTSMTDAEFFGGKPHDYRAEGVDVAQWRGHTLDIDVWRSGADGETAWRMVFEVKGEKATFVEKFKLEGWPW
ncbi:MAG: right-handed parallel beta-helix repeat-containing protein [Verrucomicrobiota bacterium]